MIRRDMLSRGVTAFFYNHTRVFSAGKPNIHTTICIIFEKRSLNDDIFFLINELPLNVFPHLFRITSNEKHKEYNNIDFGKLDSHFFGDKPNINAWSLNGFYISIVYFLSVQVGSDCFSKIYTKTIEILFIFIFVFAIDWPFIYCVGIWRKAKVDYIIHIC